MILSALRAAVLARMGKPSTDARLDSTALNRCINDALHAIEVLDDWAWLEAAADITTVNATSAYTPTAGWMRTIDLRINGRVPIARRDIEDVDLLLGASGDPVFYAIFAEQIVVAPVPTGVLTIKHRYIKAEPDLASDSDSPLIPASWQSAVISLAAVYAYRIVKDDKGAAMEMQSFAEWEERLKARAPRASSSEGGGVGKDSVAS